MSSSNFSQTDIEEFDDLADSPLSSPPTRATTDPSNLHPVHMTSDLMSSLTKLSNTSGDKRVDGQPVKPTITEKSTPISASDLSSTYKRHDRFYFDDGNITFLVEDVLYSVHRYFFCRDSSYFVDFIMNRLIPKGGNSSIPFSEPFVLDDVKSAEFDALLCILYPLNFDECELKTVESFTAVLRLATKWSLSSIRKLAISRLEPIASPVDKVVLGRTYCVDAWLLPGFIAICQRHQPLTRDEGRRLGVDDAVLVACLRESVHVCSTKPTTDGISTMVRTCLASPDIVDKGPIPIAVSKAPSAKGSRAATPPDTKQPSPPQPKPPQAPPSKDANSGLESSNSLKTIPVASPPEPQLDASKSRKGNANGPSQVGLGASMSKANATTAKDAAKDAPNPPPSNAWTSSRGAPPPNASVSSATTGTNPWATRPPKWGKALESLSSAVAQVSAQIAEDADKEGKPGPSKI
ncbi:hypothetical protein EWM64_g254 [Hericium alpestre]|uniref:BTB domain-containing protein n=1 Tax=Hericium alpestre TaxID=135208 RepID=A0A4Z0AD19_9AGAM|nr:hypothetical protein EWM64_g254 [Hericium alpestre]